MCNNAGEYTADFARNMKTRFFLPGSTRLAVEEEIRAQFDRYAELGGTLWHIDSHHHVHTDPSVWRILKRVLGNRVKIYQGVTLGALSPFDRQGAPLSGKKRHPDIQDDVIIYANATILGGDTVIGKGSIIGGNTWITKSVPPNSLIYNTKD